MSCIDLKSQFFSYVQAHPHQSSYWNQSSFMKSCNETLFEIDTLRVKVNQFDATISKNRLKVSQDQQSKMLHNLNENMKICEANLKKLQLMSPDMKSSNSKFLQQYKNSVVATIEMKLLQIGLKFKEAYQKSKRNSNKGSGSIIETGNQNTNTPNLNKPVFIEQSQQELMEQIAIAEYKGIQKSIAKISQMYKQTASIVRMHQFMIDSIQSDVNEAQGNIEGGKSNLINAYGKQSKNRQLIIKVFITLYVITAVYIIFLS